ncbi:cobalt-precorrin-5B (C(1))-methyltransferase CbiD [Bengtsoniella intestinalis]|uniref:cobalt-precorrin-5B (C(1))-methyltransferase CbiD n=1 Tax=Bengtsoniella intestinalis TaxID=3073143 RepID=UPI00391F86EA
MAKLEHYITVGQTQLRCGYTTGTCATAATRGAAEYLLTGQWPAQVLVDTPAGVTVALELVSCTHGEGWASCAVEKDGGDDPDVTHGTLVFARVERLEQVAIEVDGGIGVGRVTRGGLDQPIGQAAINSVPRQMIARELQSVLTQTQSQGGLRSVISIPDGARLASKTFNPRLGIEGGISVLGTSGIVRPMSEAALIASLKVEQNILKATGVEDMILSPGNYGETFTREVLGLSMDNSATCSNYLGDALDHAVTLGFRSILLVGHLGKLCKVAAGSFNTHSKVSDGRREVLVTHAALCGGDRTLLAALFQSITTDEAVALLKEAHLLEPVMAQIAQEIHTHLKRRVGQEMEIETLFFSNQYGILGKSHGADTLLHRHEKKEITT